MMMMSSMNCTLETEHQCPFLAVGHFVMGLLKKMGLAKGKWGCQKAGVGTKRQMGAIRKMGRHKADGAPKRQMGHQKDRWGAKKADGAPKRQMGCH
jgi:hypothetical protein